jgi:hypothetical protein
MSPLDCLSFEEFRKRTSALPLTKDKGDAFERLTQVAEVALHISSFQMRQYRFRLAKIR